MLDRSLGGRQLQNQSCMANYCGHQLLQTLWIHQHSLVDLSAQPMDLSAQACGSNDAAVAGISHVNQIKAIITDDGSNDPMDLTTEWIYQHVFGFGPDLDM